jgi:prepilin-type N-terminal cleavage/methylation domain-containing protein
MLNTQLTLTKLNTVSRKDILSSGFTLIELLVVIVILAILAVAVIVAINPAQRIAAANNSQVESNVSAWGGSAAAYAAQYGGYPQAWAAVGGTGTVAWTIPVPPVSTPYAYQASSTTNGITACTTDCTFASVAGPAVKDVTTIPQVAAGIWCFKTKTGQVINIGDATSPMTIAEEQAKCLP